MNKSKLDHTIAFVLILCASFAMLSLSVLFLFGVKSKTNDKNILAQLSQAPTIDQLETENSFLQELINENLSTINQLIGANKSYNETIQNNLKKIEEIKSGEGSGQFNFIALFPDPVPSFKPRDGYFISHDIYFLQDQKRLFRISAYAGLKIENEDKRNTVRVLYRGFSKNGEYIREEYLPQYIDSSKVKSLYDYKMPLPSGIESINYGHGYTWVTYQQIRLNSKGLPETVFFWQAPESNLDHYILKTDDTKILVNDLANYPNYWNTFIKESEIK